MAELLRRLSFRAVQTPKLADSVSIVPVGKRELSFSRNRVESTRKSREEERRKLEAQRQPPPEEGFFHAIIRFFSGKSSDPVLTPSKRDSHVDRQKYFG